jgi:hypothetical protein
MAKKPKEDVFEVKNGEVVDIHRYAPAHSIQAREDQLINMAYNMAEQQFIDGTASSQVITHFLKLGTERERMEREILNKQIALLEAKTDQIETSKANEGLYAKAIEAMKSYGASKTKELE